ncbi:Ent-kaurene oxidase [Lasiodiplodia hormozganensis]|uniref:Ent-kaurene oxidase n=1 Tax=Lasiodiplodia hormozganensis TaxID=869390 RepID=A0AA39TWH6_9PEZI|nr:Ent-kaurene oxidase [Lasiodiplodia hormozganensis]
MLHDLISAISSQWTGQEDIRRLSILIAVACLALTLALAQSKKTKQRLLRGVHVVGGSKKSVIVQNRKRFFKDSKNMLIEGYKNAPNDFYYVPTALGERLMIPTKFMHELKTAPMDQVDFVGTFIEMFEGKYTTLGSRSRLHARVVKAQLNQNLDGVMVGIQDEIIDAFKDSFPACDDWTEVPVVDRITQIVARVSSCMFGGTTLSRNDEWVQASINFAHDSFIAAQTLKKFPEFLKPVVARFIPALQNIKKSYAAAEKAAIPLLEKRSRTGESALDLLYWMSQQATGKEKDNKFLASILLVVSFAAIHTSAAAPSQLIYDLCEHPEYIATLREEYRKVIGPDGKIDKKGFIQMPLMDSIMKESQRFNPLLLITFERIITVDWTLSNGVVIPANTTIGVPTNAISMDPNLYSEPEKFDPWRFASIRRADPAQEGKAQFVSSNPASMAFGYGQHACPGRFFAAQEIKAIMVYLLENYDMKFAPGQKRPESLQFETQFLPDPTAKVLFKRRKPATA